MHVHIDVQQIVVIASRHKNLLTVDCETASTLGGKLTLVVKSSSAVCCSMALQTRLELLFCHLTDMMSKCVCLEVLYRPNTCSGHQTQVLCFCSSHVYFCSSHVCFVAAMYISMCVSVMAMCASVAGSCAPVLAMVG